VAVAVGTPLGPKSFSVSGSVIKVLGWRAIYGAEADEEADAAPGRAKVQEVPMAGRLPPVQNGEPARAMDARVEAAKIEPPRRITRGELPVVMGRLIDQVEDPALKTALAIPPIRTSRRGARPHHEAIRLQAAAFLRPVAPVASLPRTVRVDAARACLHHAPQPRSYNG
jgi:DNA topoisomerase-3